MAKTITEEIKLEARRLGFDKVGVAPADALTEEGERLGEWLARGYHGEMSWMARDPQRRADPRLLLPSRNRFFRSRSTISSRKLIARIRRQARFRVTPGATIITTFCATS